MILNLTIGIGTIFVCLAIQCVFIHTMLKDLYRVERWGWMSAGPGSTMLALMLIVFSLLVGNLIQIAIWAGVFMATDQFDDFASAFYHSVVNFSTLGYGDIVMQDTRRLLGGLEALNGVLMIGLSTSALFLLLGKLMERVWAQRETRLIKDKRHRNKT